MKVRQKTAWFMLHRIREAWSAESESLFSGPVETDETYVGGRRANMSKVKRKTLTWRHAVGKEAVVGTKDRETNRVAVRHIQHTDGPHTDGPHTAGFVAQETQPGATVYTDESSAYNVLDGQFDRESVNHSAGEYVRDQAHINGMASF